MTIINDSIYNSYCVEKYLMKIKLKFNFSRFYKHTNLILRISLLALQIQLLDDGKNNNMWKKNVSKCSLLYNIHQLFLSVGKTLSAISNDLYNINNKLQFQKLSKWLSLITFRVTEQSVF